MSNTEAASEHRITHQAGSINRLVLPELYHQGNFIQIIVSRGID